MRIRGLALTLLMPTMLSACASAYVKPLASTFVAKGNEAIAKTQSYYAQLVVNRNEAVADWLAAHPDCGLKEVIATPGDDFPAISKSPLYLRLASEQSPPLAPHSDKSYCLTAEEVAFIKSKPSVTASLGTTVDQMVKSVPLPLLSQSDFDYQMAIVQQLADYVETIARLADEPDTPVGNEIAATAASLKGLASGIEQLAHASSQRSEAIGALGGNVANLAKIIEKIAGDARDVRDIRRAVKINKAEVDANIRQIAKDVELWGCADYRSKVVMKDSLAPNYSLAIKDEISARREIALRYVELASPAAPPMCKQKSDQKASDEQATAIVYTQPPAKMLIALGRAHNELVDALERPTPAQRREGGRAAMANLASVFSATAAVIYTPLKGIM